MEGKEDTDENLRMEYPRPLLVRETWMCLNGQWQFEVDPSEVGIYKEYWNRPALDGEITVPYCPESKLSIIGWIPFNETWDDPQTGARRNDDAIRMTYRITKAMDMTRPCIDASGAIHVMTDIHDEHEYEQDPALMAEYFAEWGSGVMKGGIVRRPDYAKRFRNMGGPLYVSEYGGIGYQVDQTGWSYGRSVQSVEELAERYRGLTNVLLEHEHIMGFCYTQLYDIEQEQNGLLTYERRFKLDPRIIYEINTQTAKIEADDRKKLG